MKLQDKLSQIIENLEKFKQFVLQQSLIRFSKTKKETGEASYIHYIEVITIKYFNGFYKFVIFLIIVSTWLYAQQQRP